MIEVKDISKSFKENMVLDSITMTASDGEITSIIGSNGAGKSTLIAIIMGYYFSDRGTVQSGNVSVMPDANAMFEDVTGLEFLNFISDLKNVPREEAVKYAEILGIKDDLQKKIQGYSFGMRKKISFIQAAIGKFQNYIFDEPTSGVDGPSAQKMLEIILTLKKNGAAILLTSHNLEELERVSDYIYVLEDGKITREGTVIDITSRTYLTEKDSWIEYILRVRNIDLLQSKLTEYFPEQIDSETLLIKLSKVDTIYSVFQTLQEVSEYIDEFYLYRRSLRDIIYGQWA